MTYAEATEALNEWAKQRRTEHPEVWDRPIQHIALPVHECPVIGLLMPDPDGRDMQIARRWQVAWPSLKHCFHIFSDSWAEFRVSGGDGGDIGDWDELPPPIGDPVTCVVMIESDAERHRWWHYRWVTVRVHHHVCAECYRRGFGAE